MAAKRELTKFLNDLTKEQLIKEFEKMYQKFKEVKIFYDVELSGDTSNVLVNAKDKIYKEFFPARGFGDARTSVIKKIIDEFIRISIYSRDVIDLNLYRVEMAIRFTNTYGTINEAFYVSTENAFAKTLKMMAKHQYLEEYKVRCKKLVNEGQYIGCGFSDALNDLYYNYYQS